MLEGLLSERLNSAGTTWKGVVERILALESDTTEFASHRSLAV